MIRLIGESLGPAFAAGISPVPLIGLTVILTSKRGVAGGLAFTLGWILAVFGGIVAFGLLGQAAASSNASATDNGVSIPWPGPLRSRRTQQRIRRIRMH